MNVILAHCGCFVPAEFCSMQIFRQVRTRACGKRGLCWVFKLSCTFWALSVNMVLNPCMYLNDIWTRRHWANHHANRKVFTRIGTFYQRNMISIWIYAFETMVRNFCDTQWHRNCGWHGNQRFDLHDRNARDHTEWVHGSFFVSYFFPRTPYFRVIQSNFLCKIVLQNCGPRSLVLVDELGPCNSNYSLELWLSFMSIWLLQYWDSRPCIGKSCKLSNRQNRLDWIFAHFEQRLGPTWTMFLFVRSRDLQRGWARTRMVNCRALACQACVGAIRYGMCGCMCAPFFWCNVQWFNSIIFLYLCFGCM